MRPAGRVRSSRAALVIGLPMLGIAGCVPPAPGAGDCPAALLPGDLVITEVFADDKAPPGGAGTDAGKEWIEIYNARGAALDLRGVAITHSRLDGSRARTHAIGAATITPGQFFILGNAAPPAVPAYVDYGYGDALGDLYNTGGGKLALRCGGHEIDSAVYDDVREGHARALTRAQPPEYTLNDDQARWCQASATEFTEGNFGTPGTDNDCQPVVLGQCSDGGVMRDAIAPGPGDLVITEVMPSPARVGDAAGEWFEARALRDLDLNGVGLDRTRDSDPPTVITTAACVRVAAGSDVVFARSTADNGGIPAAAIAGTFTFSLVSGTPAAPGDVAIVAETAVVDAISWTRAIDGVSLQLAPDRIDAVANDAEANFCAATGAYGDGDLGTPGAANSPCELPTGTTCDDGGARRSIVTPAPGQLVISEILANPARAPAGSTATDAQREWFEIANTGGAAFDLNELAIGRIGGAGAPVRSAGCITVPPGGFAVLARSADAAANGMLPAVAATLRFGVVDVDGDIQITAGDTVLDVVTWTSVTSGASAQLDPRRLSATANDDPASFCLSTAPYGDLTNHGTPGAANDPCR
jgi:hypothetical protein